MEVHIACKNPVPAIHKGYSLEEILGIWPNIVL